MLQHLTLFQDEIATARGMVRVAHQTDAAGTYLWDVAARSMIVESSFMKVFLSWESFLENTFLDYMLGAPSTSGNPLLRHVSPMSRDHANKILIGGAGRQPYFDWSTPDTVRRGSLLFFDLGRPYEKVLAEIHPDLLDLKTVRNSASHRSATTGVAFDGLATRKLKRNATGMPVAEFLLSIDPDSAPNDTFFNTYASLLEGAAAKIAAGG